MLVDLRVHHMKTAATECMDPTRVGTRRMSMIMRILEIMRMRTITNTAMKNTTTTTLILENLVLTTRSYTGTHDRKSHHCCFRL